jgi:plastocyanin
VFVLGCSLPAYPQNFTVTAQVDVASGNPAQSQKDKANVVVWLSSLTEAPAVRSASPAPLGEHPRLLQKNKRFDPHILVIPVGSAVEFPNRDPFFHNVFSLFEGKRFDLGLYEAGTSRMVHFDRPGVSYIFCNIHPEMSAAVIALKSPYYAISNPAGKITILHVPAGRYLMQVWAEGTSAENLKALSRDVTISVGDASLGMLRVLEDSPPAAHKNKYGRDYDAPGSDYPPSEQK